MTPISALIVAAKDDTFDALFKQSTRIQQLSGDKEEEDKISKFYDRLSDQIEKLGISQFGKVKAEEYFYDSLDWWPNHTRYIEASVDGFTQAYYDGLRGLLVGDFENWRIQVVVYADKRDGQTMFGSIAIWNHRILIDRALYALLRWRGFDFRCEGKLTWASPSNPVTLQP